MKLAENLKTDVKLYFCPDPSIYYLCIHLFIKMNLSLSFIFCMGNNTYFSIVTINFLNIKNQ